MTASKQIRLCLTANKSDAEIIFERLDLAFEDEGFPVANTEIDEDREIFEVSVYAPEENASDVDGRMAAALTDFSDVSIRHESIPDIDWVTKTLEDLPPVRAGRFIVHGSHDRGAAQQHELAIEIEAGRAFGTGHHGTTAGCLDMISEVTARRRPQNTLDLGAGSAVLAIAVAKLAHTPVLATDIDAVAIDVARRNVRLNQVQSRVRCETATGFGHRAFAEHGPFDLIIANILPAPLMTMAPDIAAHLAPGGDVILSGILTSQRRRVISAFNLQSLWHRKTLVRGEWVTLHLSR